MTNVTHKFKVGQSVDLIPSVARSAPSGYYKIVGLRPAEGESLQYRIKSRSGAHERVVAEADLTLSAHRNFDD
jgi:hypothetical protein